MSAFGGKADITGSPGPDPAGLFLLTLPNVSGCSSLPVAPGPIRGLGDLDGLTVWKRILAAVEELQSKDRPIDATVN